MRRLHPAVGTRANILPVYRLATQGALQFGPIEELRKKYPEAVVAGFEWAAKNFGYASPKETGPRLVIVPLN